MPLSRILRRAALAALVVAGAARAQAPVAEMGPCAERDFPPGSRCGIVRVPENRAVPGGRQIALKVAVVPAATGGPARVAMTFFGGGPGQSVTSGAGFVAQMFAGVRDGRDLLLVDQRGTGGSGGLDCDLRDPRNPQSYLDDFLPPARVAACRDSLARTADLTRYGFPELAHDMEAVRVALGYDKLDLWGGSYGTRAAQVYLRMYPNSVRTAVLHGVVPPGYYQPADYARSTDAALAGLFAACRADAACGAAFPNAEAELREVAARLDRAPAEAEILDPGTRRRVRLSLSRGTFAETIRKMMYEPASARAVPFVVHRAYQGDYRPVVRNALGDRRATAKDASWGLYLAITCSEDVPFVDRAAAARENGVTLLGDYRVRQQAAACEGWPRYQPPAGYHDLARSDVPVLLISGGLDPVTPPSGAERAARAFPNSLHVLIPQAAHGYESLPGAECVTGLIVRFVREASVRALDTSCVARVGDHPFVLDIPEPIALDAAALGRYAGTFANADGSFVVRVDPIDGALHVHGLGFDWVASPLTATRFRWEGLPPGFEIEFAADGASAILRGPGEPDMRITRRP